MTASLRLTLVKNSEKIQQRHIKYLWEFQKDQSKPWKSFGKYEFVTTLIAFYSHIRFKKIGDEKNLFTWRYNQNYDSVICRPRIASLFFSAFSAATVTDIQWLILMMISAKLLYQWHGNYEKFGLKIQLKFRVKYSEILKHMIMFVWPILCYRLWEVVRFVRPAWPIGLSQAPQYQPCWEMSTIVLKEGFVFVLPLVIEL